MRTHADLRPARRVSAPQGTVRADDERRRRAVPIVLVTVCRATALGVGLIVNGRRNESARLDRGDPE
jgi:hypothetical protein